ncbi:unnamed protein product [Callosobruchus maculatus]|uniref:Uncharacterized protein n=1 Tax=Callosobruchus maculatus TaxID=64391 RepID=A0A653DFB2_CALMS|nr:unnamed protein product [Callosobruchus maculatus]
MRGWCTSAKTIKRDKLPRVETTASVPHLLLITSFPRCFQTRSGRRNRSQYSRPAQIGTNYCRKECIRLKWLFAVGTPQGELLIDL